MKIFEKDDILAAFNERIRSQEEKFLKHVEVAEDLRQQNEELSIQCTNLNEVYDMQKALVSEYRGKNDTLTDLLGEYKEYKDIIKNLKKDLEDERNRYLLAEFKLLEKDNGTRCMGTKFEDIKGSFHEELQRAKFKKKATAKSSSENL